MSFLCAVLMQTTLKEKPSERSTNKGQWSIKEKAHNQGTKEAHKQTAEQGTETTQSGGMVPGHKKMTSARRLRFN